MTTFATFRHPDDVLHWIQAGEPRELPAPTVEDQGLRFFLPNAIPAGKRRDGSVAKLPTCLCTWHPSAGTPPTEAPYVVPGEGGTYRALAPVGWVRPSVISTFPNPQGVTPPPSIPSESDRRSAAAWDWIRRVGVDAITVQWSPTARVLFLAAAGQTSPVPNELPVTRIAYGSLALAQWVAEGSPATPRLSTLATDANGVPTNALFEADAIAAPPLRRWVAEDGSRVEVDVGDVLFVCLRHTAFELSLFQAVVIT